VSASWINDRWPEPGHELTFTDAVFDVSRAVEKIGAPGDTTERRQ
jgi:hypothetical protein